MRIAVLGTGFGAYHVELYAKKDGCRKNNCMGKK